MEVTTLTPGLLIQIGCCLMWKESKKKKKKNENLRKIKKTYEKTFSEPYPLSYHDSIK